jgi:hypothetical protein
MCVVLKPTVERTHHQSQQSLRVVCVRGLDSTQKHPVLWFSQNRSSRVHVVCQLDSRTPPVRLRLLQVPSQLGTSQFPEQTPATVRQNCYADFHVSVPPRAYCTVECVPGIPILNIVPAIESRLTARIEEIPILIDN